MCVCHVCGVSVVIVVCGEREGVYCVCVCVLVCVCVRERREGVFFVWSE